MSKKESTFHERLATFIAAEGLKPTSFEAAMEFSNGSIGKTLSEKRALGSDRLETIVYKYPNLNVEWLLTGKGKMYKRVENDEIDHVAEERIQYGAQNSGGIIPITDIKAAAGKGYINQQNLKATDFVQLPASLTKRGKKYLCIGIKGHSMSPTLQDGGYVVISMLEQAEWETMQSDRIYVVSDIDGTTYLKRVRNRFQSGGFIVLTSDNPDKATFPNFNLKMDEITSVWYVEWYLSARLPNIHDQFYSRLERLENTIEDMQRKFSDLEQLEVKTIKPKKP